MIEQMQDGCSQTSSRNHADTDNHVANLGDARICQQPFGINLKYSDSWHGQYCDDAQNKQDFVNEQGLKYFHTENCEINSPGKIRDSIISNNSKIIQSDKSTDEKIFLLGEGTKIYL